MTDAPSKKAKRANAEGSVFFWKGRGWYAAVTNADGRRVMRKAPKQTERGAEQHLRKLLAERDADALTRKSMTLAQFVDEWIRAAKRRNCRPRTLESYREKIERHVVPALGRTRLDRISAAAVDRLYDDLAEAGLSPTTVAEVHTRLSSLLKLAKKRRLVPTIVTELVDPPKARKYDARTLTVSEAKHLLRGVAPHRFGPLWTFILGTGCRFGEAVGVRWQDVDRDAGVVRFRQIVNRYKVDGRVTVTIDDQTKTEAGTRDVPLPRWVAEALRVQFDRVQLARTVAGDRWTERDLVFPNGTGGPLRESHVIVEWHAALVALGLEDEGKEGGRKPLRMHDLRHSKGTLMADEGEDLVVIQKTLGHARASTTADLYVGRVPKALRGAAERYGELLDPAAEPAPEAVR
ncbi:MAG: site-specific integrase [Chloroflexota bacterium]|nr:site-specific integrase [Chloroflexota bacterium]